MKLARLAVIASLALPWFGLPSTGIAAVPPDLAAETKSEVPALTEFHEVIYRIWHEAWPAKDTALLAKLRPDVDKGVAAIAAAPLPGILRDRAATWKAEVARLQALATEYGNSVAAKDDVKLLAAAEKLHGQFEALIRVVRPRVKEMEAFHTVLYRVWHYELPGKDFAAVRRSSGDLVQSMKLLEQAQLSPRQAAIKQAFEEARAKLGAAVKELAAAPAGDDAGLKALVEKVHSGYEKLEAVFN
jgi:hypothetical protein